MRISDWSSDVCSSDLVSGRAGVRLDSGAAQVAQVARIDRQIAGEGAAERLVGRDQYAQPLVDLAIHPLPTLLDRHHDDQPDADADQRDERQPDQRRADALPRGEIQIAHDRLALPPGSDKAGFDDPGWPTDRKSRV